MDAITWALVVGIVALVIALACFCITIYLIFKPPRDQDVEQLGDAVALLTRRARADTMRRVRQEAQAPPADGVADIAVPPQLKASLDAANVARDPRAMKAALRQKLLAH